VSSERSILEIAVREWLLKTRTESGDPEVQRILHAKRLIAWEFLPAGTRAWQRQLGRRSV